MPVDLIEVTSHEIVVLKPAGLASELPHDPAADSLVRRLAAQGFTDLRLVHRLDAPACGLMLVARSAEAAAHYAREIAARRWHKWYVARVAVSPQKAEQLVGAHKSYLKVEGRSARVVRAGGKPSFLDVVLAAPVPDSPNESHLLVQLHTGRLHQIRVMLAHLGAPLSGDVRYGSPSGTDDVPRARDPRGKHIRVGRMARVARAHPCRPPRLGACPIEGGGRPSAAPCPSRRSA